MNSVVLKEMAKVADSVVGLTDNVVGLTDKLIKLEAKVCNMSTQGGNANNGEDQNEDNRRRDTRPRYIKCRSCEERRVYCTHCNKCGEGGHKRKDCPQLAAGN